MEVVEVVGVMEVVEVVESPGGHDALRLVCQAQTTEIVQSSPPPHDPPQRCSPTPHLWLSHSVPLVISLCTSDIITKNHGAPSWLLPLMPLGVGACGSCVMRSLINHRRLEELQAALTETSLANII
ncbi:hypothetical protein EYF80_043345 [Liparis tanakae]|uniref:Uncharacterized protein n=1 Tax=Liparis tanakae TaxID=230148 RepID=A0A4Z2FYV3_9TELE|nr:hypothetical protein EYF80_043345 [Liparis tanakae]